MVQIIAKIYILFYNACIMLHRNSLTMQERRHPAPDLQGDELSELADIVKFLLKRKDIAELSGDSTKGDNRFKRIKTSSHADFIVKDEVTGYYVKGSDATTTKAEYETMKYLNTVLTEQEIGISAVRLAYIVIPASDRLPSISVVEPAAGKTLHAMYRGLVMGSDGVMKFRDTEALCKESLDDVTERLDTALTELVRRVLVSDIHGGNLLVDDNGAYTIIDQPNPEFSKYVLRWLRRKV